MPTSKNPNMGRTPNDRTKASEAERKGGKTTTVDKDKTDAGRKGGQQSPGSGRS
jgi:general stress protein YciG